MPVAIPATRAAGAEERASSGCGKTAASGVTTQHLTVNGSERDYLLSAPARYDPTQPRRSCSTSTGSGRAWSEQAFYTPMAEKAGHVGYVVITPDGQGDVLRRWSLLPSGKASPDVDFVRPCSARPTARSASMPGGVFADRDLQRRHLLDPLVARSPAGLPRSRRSRGSARRLCAPVTPRGDCSRSTARPIRSCPIGVGDYFWGAPRGTDGLDPSEATPVDGALTVWAAFDGCGTPPTPTPVADDVQQVMWPRLPHQRRRRALPGDRWGHTWPGSLPVSSGAARPGDLSINAT